MLFDDGATIDQLMATLNVWAKRTDAYPGHLPHIYTELARAGNGAQPTKATQRPDKGSYYIRRAAELDHNNPTNRLEA